MNCALLILVFNFNFSVLSALLLILSWYQSLGRKPLHSAWRAARSQEEEHNAYIVSQTRARDAIFFTELVEQYAQKIIGDSKHGEAEL
jgi:hypothetical protein